MDLIDRQMAIDAVENCEQGEELFVIKSLPSAQMDNRITVCPMCPDCPDNCPLGKEVKRNERS